jgi:tRNA threonylcarbamoyladenosine biosynthesis protein TsaE
MISNLRSNSPEETRRAGEALGRTLRGDEIVLLSGELGAGKTLFVKGLAEACDIPEAEVVSPSYVLMNVLEGRLRILHFDLYRLGELGRPEDFGITEYLGSGVVVVEWAQYLKPDYFSGEPVIQVIISGSGDDGREIMIATGLSHIRLP